MKKKLKGMTLIEIIISMAIFGIMSLLMVQVGLVSKSFMMNANHVNKKTLQEAPYGASQDSNGLLTEAAAINAAKADPSIPDVQVETTPVTITVGTYGSVTANRFSTRVAAQEDEFANTDRHMQGDLEFYVIN